MSKNMKDGDSTAAKIQTLMLDAVAPLVHILEEGQKGTLTPEVAIKASKVTLGLLGNASAHQSKERQKNVLKDMNRDVMSLAEEEDQFKDAAPLLFGDGLEKKMKEHMDVVRCIRKTNRVTEQHFRGAAPKVKAMATTEGVATTEGGVDTASSPTTLHSEPSRKRKLSEEIPQQVSERIIKKKCQKLVEPTTEDCSIVYAYKCISIESLLPNKINSFPSEMVKWLAQMGIVLLARDHAKRGLPLAGRLRHFL